MRPKDITPSTKLQDFSLDNLILFAPLVEARGMIKTHLWNISFSDLHACIHMNHKGWILSFPELIIWGRASSGTRTRMSSAHQRVDSWALRTWRTSLVQFPAPGIHSSYSQQWQSSLWARHGDGAYFLGKGGHTTGSGLCKFFSFSFDLEILCLEHGGISVWYVWYDYLV